MFILQWLSVDSDSCPQGFSSVPPPPPSPVSNPTHPCSSLAVCMPSHSDLFTLSPLPEGDEVSESTSSPHGVICSSPPPLPIAPPECGVPSLTPIPEGEETAPSTTISEKSTPTFDVITTPCSLSPHTKILVSYSATPESVPCSNSPLMMSPELIITPTMDLTSSPVPTSSPICISPSTTSTVHKNIDEPMAQSPQTSHSFGEGEQTSVGGNNPIYTCHSTVTSSTFATLDSNFEIPVNAQECTQLSSSAQLLNNGTSGSDVLQPDNIISCDSVITNEITESELQASHSSEISSSSSQPPTETNISSTHTNNEESSSQISVHSDAIAAPNCQPNFEAVNSASHLDSHSHTVSLLHSDEVSNIDNETSLSDTGINQAKDEIVQSEIKSEKIPKEKTVRFNLDDCNSTLSEQSANDSSQESLSITCELESATFMPQNTDNNETVVTHTQEQCEEHKVGRDTNITSSTLSPSQAKTESVSSESDKDIKVATMVPVTSANTLLSSHSVLETNESEIIEMSSQTPQETFETPTTFLKETVYNQETKAEMLETHSIELNTTVAQESITTHMQVEAECNLQPESGEQSTDLLEAHYSTLDYSSDSVASTGSQPDPYKVNTRD